MNQSRYWREKNAELSAKNDALRQQLADVSNERDNFKAAYMEWSDKTDWVQASAHFTELGKHRADVMNDRLKASEARNAEAERLMSDAGLLLALLYPEQSDVNAWREAVGAWIPQAQPPQTNTSNQAHCPHDGICHTSDETCDEAKARIADIDKTGDQS